MCRLITIFAIVLVSANASGQGKILFANDSNHLFVLYGNPLPVSPLSTGHTLLAALYAGHTSGTLFLQTTVTLDASGMLTAGRMVNKPVTLANIAGGTTVYFQIFVMDTGATRPNAIPGGAGPSYFPDATYIGTSGLFTAVPGTSITFPNIETSASCSTWAAGTLEASGCLGCMPPVFQKNLSNVWVTVGGNVTLSVSTWSYPPPGYLWRKQGVHLIDWTTNSSLTLTNVTLNHSGNYDVIASNPYGSTTSAVATVTVIVPAVLGSPSYNASSQFQFTVTGAPGTNYIVEVSTNLLTSQWISVFTNPSPFTFIDTGSTGIPSRFYRAYSP